MGKTTEWSKAIVVTHWEVISAVLLLILLCMLEFVKQIDALVKTYAHALLNYRS